MRTITETIVRNWERRRRAAEAHARGVPVAQLADEERRDRLARLLAAHLAAHMQARTGGSSAPPPVPAPPPASAVHPDAPAPPPPAAPPRETPRETPDDDRAPINDIAAMVDHIQEEYYR